MNPPQRPHVADPVGQALAPSGAALRAAALIHVALGLGFGLGTVWTLDHFGRHGELPLTPWGFRSLAGPFEVLPASQFVALGWALVTACALDVVAGLWLWQARRRGAVLGLVTGAVQFVLGLGFALPFLLLGVPLRAALTALGRRALRP